MPFLLDTPAPGFEEMLLGRTIINHVTTNDKIIFYTSDQRKFKLYHRQDCCESVYIESIVGNIEDLYGYPLIFVEESTPHALALDEYDHSHTWTFYRLRNHKGDVTIRFYGTSNGYYSEKVDFMEIK